MSKTIMNNFIQRTIENDLKNGTYQNVHTRFPPEPNGYLHIGHAKSICLNFGIANHNNGLCNLRFDDTNPSKEDIEYINSIKEDIRWLGFDWQDRLFFTSDYFDQLYEYAVQLIKKGLAYVDDSSAEEISLNRGTLTEPGVECPFRSRSIEENLTLFEQMKNGIFADGTKVLRAKIDMASPNMNMRDPIIYRISHTAHHRTSNKWCIYPMYDFAHPLSDAIENITHSICTLEFEDHRPFYDWLLESLNFNPRPRQIEFARLNLTNTVTSKRKLLNLIENNHVSGWDDPRLSTLAGMRRRGFTPTAIKNFCDEIGVAKSNSSVDIEMLEHFVREDLNKTADRVMAVLNPIKVVLTNLPDTEYLIADNPINSNKRYIPFTREIYIERDDFMEDPPKKFFRLSPNNEVRLKYAYIIKCEKVIKDVNDNIIELHCTIDPNSKSGQSTRKVKSTIHWVPSTALKAEARLYDYLYKDDVLNPDSLITKDILIEPSIKYTAPGTNYQFLRLGYFIVDKDSTFDHLIFNHTLSLKDNKKHF